MKIKTYLSISLLIILLGINLSLASASTCNPTIQLVSQDPSPAVPSEYVKLIFEVTDIGSCEGLAVQLVPEYPFSLDTLNTAQTIQTNPYASDYKSSWTLPYKLRVDEAAFDGDYTLKLKYHEGTNLDMSSSIEDKFNITIDDARTKFDAVIQEFSTTDVSIAIANVGKYTANSLVVRIPEQDSFVVTGTDGQMVGNLESGDYTIVGFSLTPKVSMQSQQNRTRIPGSTFSNISYSSNQISPRLKFDISYTDNIGERRTVNMELPLNMRTNNSSLAGAARFNGARTTATPSFFSQYEWEIILVVLVVLLLIYNKYHQQILLALARFHSRKKKESSSTTAGYNQPDWVKHAKEKEKKK